MRLLCSESERPQVSRFRLSQAETCGRAPQSRASRKSRGLASCRSFVDFVVFPQPATVLLTWWPGCRRCRRSDVVDVGGRILLKRSRVLSLAFVCVSLASHGANKSHFWPPWQPCTVTTKKSRPQLATLRKSSTKAPAMDRRFLASRLFTRFLTG
jgi:hypothetical protein